MDQKEEPDPPLDDPKSGHASVEKELELLDKDEEEGGLWLLFEAELEKSLVEEGKEATDGET